MGENINNIKNLLQNVAIIQRKYDEFAVITGENFNVFSVLKMDSNEVRMHSGFIGELLNPKGSHGLKEQPLKIFIDLLNSKFNKTDIKEDENKFFIDKFILNTESAITTVEKYIGFTNEDKTEGGRIDIIIEDKNKNAIIIENKIYAIEQTNQLIRYNNYSKNAPILYLTLYGVAPSSANGLIENHHYFNISYEYDIKNWLELCLKEAVEYPMLREVIKQYIYLIKKLTNQTTNNKMSKDIVERMEKDIQASFEVANNLRALKKKIFYDFIESLKNSNELKFENCENIKYYGVDAVLENYKRISILFGKNNEKDDFALDVSIGFLINNNINISNEIKEKYRDNGFIVDDWWIYKRFSTYNINSNNWNWTNNIAFWEDIQKGTESLFYQDIKEIINKILEIEKITN